ncbi:MAG TPA: hypothetical protein VEA58_03795 [Anaerovoracaceae bacterium]|nr:hypothetical protein [Anaerovoracaceae bacterium]
MTNPIPNFDLDDIVNSSPKVFGKPEYDALYCVAKLLFGESCVKANPKLGVIQITGNIYLEISLSSNECKAYFYTYVVPKEYYFPAPADVRRAFMNVNEGFRLFALEAMVEYLQLKANESDFIRRMEG